jgi:hypothetical protein
VPLCTVGVAPYHQHTDQFLEQVARTGAVEIHAVDAPNDSPGLKIAVAAFISLTVILAVSLYFLYSAYSMANAKLIAANEMAAREKNVVNLLLHQYETLRAQIGTKAEDIDAATNEVSASFKRVDDRLIQVERAVDAAVQTARQNGVQGPELDQLKANVQQAIASYRNDPNKNYIASLNRLTDALENLALLTTRLSTR